MVIPERPQIGNYRRPPRDLSNFVPDFAARWWRGDREVQLTVTVA